MDNKYPYINERNVTLVINGGRHIYVSTIYKALCFLRDNGETTLDSPYPIRKSFSYTNNPPEVCRVNAFTKCKIVLESVIKEYQYFIYNRFPKIAPILDLFQDNNLLVVVFNYSHDSLEALIQLNFFKADNPSDSKVILFEDLNNKSELFENIDYSSSWLPFWDNKEIVYKGRKYVWTYMQNLSAHDVIFGKYNAITLFYKFLERKFRDYFKIKDIN